MKRVMRHDMEQRIIADLRINPWSTRKQLQFRLNATEAQVHPALTLMLAEGLITRKGMEYATATTDDRE